MNRQPVRVRTTCKSNVAAGRPGVLTAVLAVAVWGLVTPATALNITVVPDLILSGHPAQDLGLTKLVAITDAAANAWEQIIQEPWNLQVTVSYFPTGHAGGAETNLQQIAVGKPLFATIELAVFDGGGGEYELFFDPTPTDHSEYDLETNLYAGLDAETQTEYFNGNVPAGLEVAHVGNAKPGQTAAEDGWDVFSVMLHELGHALGMSNLLGSMSTPALVETQNDFDYDVPSALVGGQSMAVRTFGEDNDPGDPRDWAHIANESLMHAAGFPDGRRELITATDVFAVVSASSFDPTQVDLPGARYFISGDLADDSRWIGGRKPNPARDAYVISGVGLATTGSIQTEDFRVGLEGSSDGATVLTLANTIEVFGDVFIEGNSLIENDVSTLSVSSGGLLLARSDVFVQPAGILNLSGGDVRVDGLLGTFAEGTVKGHGQVLLVFGPNLLINNGLIQGTGGADELFISSVGFNTLDIDGSLENGRIEAVLGDVRFGAGTLADAFDGTLTVGAGRKFTFTQDWEVGADGDVALNGTADSPAVIAGGTVTIGGAVTADGAGEFRSPTVFTGTADVRVPNAGDMILLTGHSEFAGAAFTGDGSLVQGADIDVVEDTTIDSVTFDWGNGVEESLHQITVHAERELVVNASGSGEAENPYRGVVLLDGGTLTVNMAGPWLLPGVLSEQFPDSFGQLTLQKPDGAGTAHLRGQPVTVDGTVVAKGGTSFIHADITVRASGQINVDGSNDVLVLEKNTGTFAGGKIVGNGTLAQHGDIHVTADTGIDTTTFDWGNSITSAAENRATTLTVDEGVVFTVNSTGTGTPANDYRGTINVDGGRLIVNTNSEWAVPTAGTIAGGTLPAGVLNLNQPGSGVPSVENQHVRIGGQLNVDASRAQIDSVTLDTGSLTSFVQNGDLLVRQALHLAAGAIDHGTHSAGIITENNSTLIEWVGDTDLTLEGEAAGVLSIALGANTTVSVSPNHTPTLTIDPGATLTVAGDVDPFQDSSNPAAQVTVINNSTNTLNLKDGIAVDLAELTGVGHTVIQAGSSLAADAIEQGNIRVEPTAEVSIRQVDSRIATTAGLVIDGRLSVDADKLAVFGPTTNNGEVHLPFGHTVRFIDAVNGAGTVTGSGTVVYEGELSPGNSTAAVTASNIEFAESGGLVIELAGAGQVAGQDFDQVNITGNVALDGELTIDVLARFDDQIIPTDDFKIMTWASNFGQTKFAAVGVANEGLRGLVFDLIYDENSLTIIAGALDGDANLDGTVGLDDLVALAANYLDAADPRDWRRGNFNMDAVIDADDLALMAANFGLSPSSDPLGLTVGELADRIGLPLTATPEPATLALMSVGGVVMLRRGVVAGV